MTKRLVNWNKALRFLKQPSCVALAKKRRYIGIVSPFVCPSVRPSVRPSRKLNVGCNFAISLYFLKILRFVFLMTTRTRWCQISLLFWQSIRGRWKCSSKHPYLVYQFVTDCFCTWVKKEGHLSIVLSWAARHLLYNILEHGQVACFPKNTFYIQMILVSFELWL